MEGVVADMMTTSTMMRSYNKRGRRRRKKERKNPPYRPLFFRVRSLVRHAQVAHIQQNDTLMFRWAFCFTDFFKYNNRAVAAFYNKKRREFLFSRMLGLFSKRGEKGKKGASRLTDRRDMCSQSKLAWTDCECDESNNNNIIIYVVLLLL
jgi:hypothetical protein